VVSYDAVQMFGKKVELMTFINMMNYAWGLKLWMRGSPRDVGLVSTMHVTVHASRNTKCGTSFQNSVLRHLPACVESLDVMGG
jgi:hypothetical protein